MKFKLLLFFALLLTVSMSLFPSIAQQTLSIEALGWQFETKQGAFAIVVLLLLFIGWFLQRLTQALTASPGKVWQTLRSGGQKRREQHLQDALAQYIDMRNDAGQRKFKKARALLPAWGQSLLDVISRRPNAQPAPSLQNDPLHIALAARLTTDPEWSDKIDLSTRKAHLEAWLQAHPDAPLARIRLLDLLLEEGEWQGAIELMKALGKQPLRSAHWLEQQKVRAYLALAKQDAANSVGYLRQAEGIAGSDGEVILALGQELQKAGDHRAAEKLWLSHLKKFNDIDIAVAALALMQEEGLAAFRRIEKIKGSDAMRWLHASLAHAGKLDGLAQEALSELLEKHPCRLFWQTQAQWYGEKGEWQKAMSAYEQALQSPD